MPQGSCSATRDAGEAASASSANHRVFWDPRTHRYYNSQGVWVDSLGQLMPHSRPAGRFRSKGKWWATDRPLTLWWNQHHVSACFSDVLIIGWSDLRGYGLRTTPCGDFLIRFNRFDYVFDSTDFRPPGDLETRGFRSVPCRLLPAVQDAAWLQLAVILGDEDSASEVRSLRFIISDLSDIFISDIFILPVH